MKKVNHLLLLIFISIFSTQMAAQNGNNIQGTWRMLSTTITNAQGELIVKMDSSTHNLTKIITPNRIMFTIYYKQSNDSLMTTGQGRVTINGNQYTETFEQSTSKYLLRQPMVFTYKLQGNKLSYEGGIPDFHIVEVLQRLE